MTWDEYFKQLVHLVALKSKDPTTKVGCLIVDRLDNSIICTGYNGLPRGVIDVPYRMDRPTKYLYTVHAEANTIAYAARKGVSLKGSRAIITHRPCAQCTAMLIQAGVAVITYYDGQAAMLDYDQSEAAFSMCSEAGVIIERGL